MASLPPAVRKFTRWHGSRRPDEAMRRLAEDFVARSSQTNPPFRLQPMLDLAPVPIDPIIRIHAMAYAGSLTEYNQVYRIEVNARHSRGRQRFSVAHELGHAFFIPFSEENRYRIPGTAHDSAIEERLCNIFATNVLMPEEYFRRDLSGVVTAESVLGLAKAYDVSVETTALRIGEVLRPKQPVIGLLSPPNGDGRSEEIRKLAPRTGQRSLKLWKALLSEPDLDASGTPARVADIFWANGHVSKDVVCHPAAGGWLYATTMHPG